MTALLWLTRDLRLHDHPALRAALDRHETVVPVFCLDDRLLQGRHASGPRTQFMLECLADLDERLGRMLVIRWGWPERGQLALAREVKAQEMHFSMNCVRGREAWRPWGSRSSRQKTGPTVSCRSSAARRAG